MKKNIKNWKKVVQMIKNSQDISGIQIDFNNEKIHVKEVSLLNQNSIRVPENLIFYDDSDIDCTDIPELTNQDLETGKIQWLNLNEFPLDNELRDWIVTQNIKLNELLPYLLQNFYKTIKFSKKNIAL